MLSVEGLEPEEIWIGREGYKTYTVGETGFFTIGERHGLPYIVHLCADREARGTIGLVLARRLKEVLRGMGAKRAIVNLRENCGRLLPIACRMLHAKPYAVQDGSIYLIMEVNHG
jgi:hypothetical protein